MRASQNEGKFLCFLFCEPGFLNFQFFSAGVRAPTLYVPWIVDRSLKSRPFGQSRKLTVPYVDSPVVVVRGVCAVVVGW